MALSADQAEPPSASAGSSAGSASSTWQRGGNVPHVSRNHSKGGGAFDEALQEVLGNIHRHMQTPLDLSLVDSFLEGAARSTKEMTVAHLLFSVLQFERVEHVSELDSTIAGITRLIPTSTRNVIADMRKNSWSTHARKKRVGCKPKTDEAMLPSPVDGDLPAELCDDLRPSVW